MDSHTMVYVGDGYAGNYSLNRVDLDDPTTMSSRSVGRNVSVIAADTDGKRIGVIEAVEIGYETFIGLYTKIYAADTLEPLKTFPLAPPAADGRRVEPLHHRDPSLSLTDKYAVVLTEDDGFFASGGVQQYVSVYDIAGNKGASHTNAYSGNAGGARGSANTALGVGTLMGAMVHGDFIILGGSTGTAVFKIDGSGSNLSISRVTAADSTGNHWFKNNGAYVLESKSGNGKVQVWKWNGASAPTAVGTVTVNAGGTGSVQALCFDPDDTAKAYFYCKQASDANVGKILSVDLSNTSTFASPTTEFTFKNLVIAITPRGGSTTYYNPALTGLWTIEKQKVGTDNYYVFSGSYSYTPSGGSAVTVGTVLAVKNPAMGTTVGGTYTNESSATLDTTITNTTFTAPYGTAVRTLKTFKSSSNEVFFAAKNYTANGAVSSYKLVLDQIN